MGARVKLNHAYATGSIILACVIGVLLQSWHVFIVVLIILLALSISNGDIRLNRSGHRPRRKERQ